MARTVPCIGAAIALAMSFSVDAALGQTFQGRFDKHQLMQPFGSQADRSTATATIPFSDASLFHGNFVGSIQMTAAPETLVGQLDSSAQKIVAPVQIRMTINFTSTLPQLARFDNTFQKFRTTLSAQIADAATNCTAVPRVQNGLEFGPHSYSTSLTCDFPMPSFSVTQSQGTEVLAGYSLIQTVVEFLIEPENGGFSKYRAEVSTFYRWERSDVQDLQPSVITNDPARSSERTLVKVTGANFVANSTLSFGEGITVANTRVNSATEIEAEITAAGGTPEGPRDLTLTQPNGTRQVRSGLLFVSSLAPAIEVNQGVPIECAADHPCVADHDSWVRVRLPCHGIGCSAGKAAATGRLHVKRDGIPVPGPPFLPNPTTMAVKEAGTVFDLPALKAGADALNFRFTGEGTLAEGGYTFSFEIDPRSPSALPGGTVPDLRRNLIRELAAQPFVLSRFDRAIHVSTIVDQAPAARRMRPIDPFDLPDFTRAVFPISKGRVTIAPSLHEDQYGPDVIPTLRRLQSLAVLEAVHNQPAQTYVVMFTTNPLFDTPGASSCSEGSCWGNSAVILWEGENSRASLAHELGHHQRLGDTYTNQPPGGEDRARSNPPCGHVSGCPVESGHLDTIRGEQSVALPATDPNFVTYTKRDVMGNAPRPERWIDKRTWDYLYPTFMRTGSGAQRAAAQERWLIVRGTVSDNDAVSFDPFLSYTGEEIGPRTDEGDYRVELQDAPGATLSSRTFASAFKVPHLAQTVSSSPFQATLPFPTTAVRVVVKKGARELASKPISANPPAVAITFPNGGESIGATATITWTASDPDGDPLTFSLLYSADGTRWSALASDLTGTTYPWNTAMAAGSRNARVRVVASDGVHSTTDTSDNPFNVAGKAPLVTFTSPSDGAAFAAGQPVTISGFAFDLEDGELPGSSLSYSSDRSGPLGTGRSLSVANLPAGLNTITLRAIDREGTASTVQIHITVFTPGAELNVVPVAGSTPGTGGSFFKTAVQIHNPTDATIAGNFVFHTQGFGGSPSDPSRGYMLLPRQTIAFADLLPELGQSGLGTVDLISTFGSAPTSVIRIFNDAGEAGTTGMTEELMRDEDALEAGKRGVLIGPPEPSRARFNVGVRSLASGATIRFTVRDAAGTVRSDRLEVLPSRLLRTADGGERSSGSRFSRTTRSRSRSTPAA